MSKRHTAAQSLYGQVRITVTFQRTSLRGEGAYKLDYRVLAKRYSDEWSERSVVATGSETLDHYPTDLTEALALAEEAARAARWKMLE